jgi:hypothetical protein
MRTHCGTKIDAHLHPVSAGTNPVVAEALESLSSGMFLRQGEDRARALLLRVQELDKALFTEHLFRIMSPYGVHAVLQSPDLPEHAFCYGPDDGTSALARAREVRDMLLPAALASWSTPDHVLAQVEVLLNSSLTSACCCAS